MLPLYLIIGTLGLIGLLRVGHHSAKTVTAGDMSQTYSTRPLPPHVEALLIMVRRGQEPPEWLINEAMSEAYDRRDYRLIKSLENAFGETEMDTPLPEEKEDEKTLTVSGKSSPFDGVSNESWEEFVEKLSTDDPKFSTDKHVGRFHHSRARLSQLGIEDVSSPETQYKALVKDLSDAHSASKDLIQEYIAKTITIGDQEVPITLSGLLGILKAAGVKHARSWLENDSDRGQFPQTTRVFLSTNGVF